VRSLLALICILLFGLYESKQTPIGITNITGIKAVYNFENHEFGEILGGFLGEEFTIFNSDGEFYSIDLNSYTSREVFTYNRSGYATFSLDGSKIACLCGGNPRLVDIHVLDVQSQEVIFSLPDVGSVSDMDFSPNGQQLIIAGGAARKNTFAQIWDMVKNELVFERNPEQWTSGVAVQREIAAFGYQHTIELVENGRIISTFKQYYPMSDKGGLILDVADVEFSPDGRYLASASPEGFVWLWNLQNEEAETLFDAAVTPDSTLNLYSASDTDIQFNHTGDLLVITNGQAVNFWDVKNKVLLHSVQESVERLYFNSSDTTLITISTDNTVKVWKLQ
jgi:WD40 repeat protein